MNKADVSLQVDTITVVEDIVKFKATDERIVVAIAGPPASGKSTLAASVVNHCNALDDDQLRAGLLPMDGFHLDNRVLLERGLLQKKGAPNTFDVEGFTHIVKRLHDDQDVVHPVFDRSLDMAIAGAGVIAREVSIVVVEGNYLLLDDEQWKEMQTYFDYTVFVRTSIETLEQRLMSRWLEHDYSPEEATVKVNANDLPNAELIIKNSLPAKRTIVQAE